MVLVTRERQGICNNLSIYFGSKRIVDLTWFTDCLGSLNRKCILYASQAPDNMLDIGNIKTNKTAFRTQGQCAEKVTRPFDKCYYVTMKRALFDPERRQ